MKKILTILSVLTFVIPMFLFAQNNDGKGKKLMAADHFKKMDTDNDKKVSKEEWQKFHDGFFLELDKDGDGSISFDELKGKQMENRDKMKEKAKENQKQGKKKNQTTIPE
ncbi:hypothetical protein [Leptospira bouyouniensis]|uniref:EF-hand domain-containing protein n=1 Tax=Leptospira bouyouniensis TaxID=2484911 RepID=A0ABY2L734_9LEPT|nr:hypothetical protein [Leptospira bouyouniensis]TGK52465.1 hypothetical protein EHQ10_01555 [Leptospira bouyouniensis]